MLETLVAARERLPSNAVFAARTAAWLHGFEPNLPPNVDVIVPDYLSASARVGFKVRRAELRGDVVRLRGFAATSVCRTLADLCRGRSLTEAVVFADAALNRGVVDVAALQCWVDRHRGWHGIRRFRRVVDHADAGAESAMETRLRMLLVRARLPRPETQVPLIAADGELLGRVDLFYARHRLAIEYDGEVHRDALVYDNRRQNRILAAGYELLRFTGPDLRERPEAVVAQVRAALHLSVLDPKPRASRL